MPARTLATLAAGVLVGVAAALAVGAFRAPPGVGAASRAVAAATSTPREPSIDEPSRPHGTPSGARPAFTVTEHFTLLSATDRTTRIDVGAKGRSPGDGYFATGRLYDVTGRRVVGHQHTQCAEHPAFDSADPSAYESNCTVAFVLADVEGTEQQFVAAGMFVESGSFPVSGTGPYRFVRGQATMGEGRTKDGRDTWTFDLRLKP